VYLLIAGDGSMLLECRKIVEENNLLRVKFHNPWPVQETFNLLKTADLLVLPTYGRQAFVSVPSKLLTYMFSGRCILAVAPADSEVARIITVSSAGWVIPSVDSKDLAMSLKQILELPTEERSKHGKAGQNFASQHYSKKVNLAKVVKLLGVEKTSK
jgi:glycosyltransferase involved in cell wall biosynthesis